MSMPISEVRKVLTKERMLEFKRRKLNMTDVARVIGCAKFSLQTIEKETGVKLVRIAPKLEPEVRTLTGMVNKKTKKLVSGAW